jgi:hypothetical protein
MGWADSAFFDHEVQDALSGELERLTGDASFIIAEFAADTATIFQVFRDEHGTPRAYTWRYWSDAGADPGIGPGPGPGARIVAEHDPDPWSVTTADPEQFYRRAAPRFIVCSGDPVASGLRHLLPGPREVPVYQCQSPLKDLLRGAITESPLVLGYELAVLKRGPAGRSGAERPVLAGYPLFEPGDTEGSQATVRVRVEPTDGEGTTLAVVTREPRPDLPRQTRRMRPMQVQTALVPAGRYLLTAVLTRPGRVRFLGEPQLPPLSDSSRSWDELQRRLPGQLTAQAAVHLVCLTELCGSDDRLQQRIDRLEELVAEAHTDARPLRVSVVSYGAHGVAWKVDDWPPEIRAWAAPGDEAINALRGLSSRRMDSREYQGAAQLECALRLLREHLIAADGRPVIVTAGGRPAHPPGLDTAWQLIPCPDFVDGTSELDWLFRLPGITFGALRDPQCRGGIWDRLGRDAVATVDDAVDMESFASQLGLRAAVQTVPFPVLE